MKFKHLTINCQLSTVNCQLFSYSVILSFILFFASPVKAQVTIGSQDPPHSFSVLELIAKEKDGGLRLPQIPTTKDRDAISDAHGTEPAMMGLEIFNLETNCVNTWNGFSWIEQCAPAPTLEVDPVSLTFTADAGGGGDQTVTVTTSLPSWSVTDSPVWVSLSASGNTLTVGVPNANTGDTPLTGEITIKAGTLTKTVSVTQEIDIATIPDTPVPTSANYYTYVGAFWKHNQTGERIIRIANVVAAGSGAWTASVAWYDNKWDPANGDGIIFSTDPTSDTGVTFAAGENPDNAENYQVSGAATSVSGTVAPNGIIMFRIGLQKPFAAYRPDDDANPNPARYAVVLLTTAAGTQKLYIRQGEGADYVMRNQDPVDGDTGLSERTQCMKFVPYNLTTTEDKLNTQIAVKGGIFTDYPTQSGFTIQGARISTSPSLRYAYDLYSLPDAAVWDNCSNCTLAALWNTLGSINETCPEGYRRPTNGPTDVFVDYTSAPALSEIKQSLFKTIKRREIVSGDTYQNINVAHGYYADGFFDRRQIYNGGAFGGDYSTVSINNSSIANLGSLFYNPYTNASLFFPASGVRGGTTGDLAGIGKTGRYVTSSMSGSSSSPSCYYLLVNFSRMNISAPVVELQNNASRDGYSVRCVKE